MIVRSLPGTDSMTWEAFATTQGRENHVHHNEADHRQGGPVAIIVFLFLNFLATMTVFSTTDRMGALLHEMRYFVVGTYDHYERPKYHYTVLAPYDEIFDEAINNMGKQGWKIEYMRRVTRNNRPVYEVVMSRREIQK